MKIKRVLLVALAALGLSLASIGATAPAIAGGRGGIGGDTGLNARMVSAPGAAIAGGLNGGVVGLLIVLP